MDVYTDCNTLFLHCKSRNWLEAATRLSALSPAAASKELFFIDEEQEETPLLLCVYDNAPHDLIEQMIERCKADAFHRNILGLAEEQGYTPLHYSAYTCHGDNLEGLTDLRSLADLGRTDRLLTVKLLIREFPPALLFEDIGGRLPVTIAQERHLKHPEEGHSRLVHLLASCTKAYETKIWGIIARECGSTAWLRDRIAKPRVVTLLCLRTVADRPRPPAEEETPWIRCAREHFIRDGDLACWRTILSYL